MLNLAQSYITLEKKLNTNFDNLVSSIYASPKNPAGKVPHRQREDTDKGTCDRCDRYTPLSTPIGRIYQECVNTEFKKAGI